MTRPAVLITGASRGIGLGAVHALAARGFAIALNAPPDEEAQVKAVGAAIKSKFEGVPVITACFDVADLSQHAGHLAEIDRHIGPLTTLVNNAGVGVVKRGDPLEVTEASYDRCMSVNAKAMFFLCQAFAKQLIKRPRPDDFFHSIINVTSANAVAVSVARAEYCASKAAAAMISKAFAARLGSEGIHVYDVQPGLIDTPMTASVIKDYEARAKAGLTLLPRVGTPQDMGQIIAALALGQLPYTTGQVISADGGMLVSRF